MIGQGVSGDEAGVRQAGGGGGCRTMMGGPSTQARRVRPGGSATRNAAWANREYLVGIANPFLIFIFYIVVVILLHKKKRPFPPSLPQMTH